MEQCWESNSFALCTGDYYNALIRKLTAVINKEINVQYANNLSSSLSILQTGPKGCFMKMLFKSFIELCIDIKQSLMRIKI